MTPKILKKKPLNLSLWGLAHFITIFLRSVGQTVFINNPVFRVRVIFPTGRVWSWLCSGGSSGHFELCLGLHPWSLVESGVAPFNDALVGCVLPSLYPLLHAAGLWLAVCVGSVATIFCAAGSNNFLDKFNLPFMTFPFNIISICTFLTLLPSPLPLVGW
jgi:urea transporter